MSRIARSKTVLLVIALAAVVVLDGTLLVQRLRSSAVYLPMESSVIETPETSQNTSVNPSPVQPPPPSNVSSISAQLHTAMLREQELTAVLTEALQRAEPDYETLRQIAWRQLEWERDELARTNPSYNESVNSTADSARRTTERNMQRYSLFLEQSGIDNGVQHEILQAFEVREQLNNQLAADRMSGALSSEEFVARRDRRTDQEILGDFINSDQITAFAEVQQKFRDANVRAQNAMMVTTQTRGMTPSSRDLLIESYTALGMRADSSDGLAQMRDSLIDRMSAADLVQVDIFIETRRINIDRNAGR